MQTTGSRIRSPTPRPGLSHSGVPAPSLSRSTRPHCCREETEAPDHRPTLPEQGLKVHAPLGPSGSLLARPCQDANLTLWGGSLGPSAWSVLGSVKTAISVRLQGQLGGVSQPPPHQEQPWQGLGSLPGRTQGGHWQKPSASAPTGLEKCGDIQSPACYAQPVDPSPPMPGPCDKNGRTILLR